MADRSDKFTERARKVLELAEAEARSFAHDYIGTEHLLLGLVREGNGVAANALVNLGIDLAEVQNAVHMIIRRGNTPSPEKMSFTPRAKQTIERAVDEAKQLRHHYIGTEHQLLGLLRVEDGIAAQVLNALGVSLERARTEITRMLSQPKPGDTGLKGRVADWIGREPRQKRYNLVLPEDLFNEVQALADRQGTTVVEVIRRFIKLGLLASRVQETPGSALIIREDGREREILLL